MERLLYTVREWVARRLGIEAREAKTGMWWEIDLVLVILVGSGVVGLARLFGY